ncbi:MAG: hypothetical protein HY235_19550 [Acidobacteria bacterium]|nr:hypothetical protein [Acidobacteriota bacterium]
MNRRDLFLGAAASTAAAQNRSSSSAPFPVGRRFTGEALREIAFPLGGIGTGTVSVGGYGNLRDWEIFNRPNKGGTLPFTFVAARLAGGGLRQPLIRVLERRPHPPFTGSSGVARETGVGLPRLREAVFTGSYPFAEIRFQDPKIPVEISLEAFNPMIPLDTDNSSLPVAALTYSLRSLASSRIEAALAFSLMNPIGYDGVSRLQSRRAGFFGQNLNEFRKQGDFSGLLLSSTKHASDWTQYGSLALATNAAAVSYRLEWEHGEWWDEFQKWWDEFLGRGRFPSQSSKPSAEGTTEYATLAAHFALDPSETKKVTFVLSWLFPNTQVLPQRDQPGAVLKNHYGTRWSSSWEPAVYTLGHLSSLRERSARYRDLLYLSGLPPAVIDAVSSQASIVRTNTVMVMEGKRVLAYEGSNDHAGCCPMNCTHVYNYEQALAHLYPDLERNMRETDFLINMRPDGSMGFRTAVPLKEGGRLPFPAADGQMGCVMKVYREWRLGGDDQWLGKLWPQVKRALEYAWAKWDADRDGVMEGEQHNTYDIEFYGPNTMMGTLYLGALAAAARMGRHLGDTAAADSYQKLFEEGSKRLDQLLWNGEYYIQRIDERAERARKYQYGEGCLSDQLLGQWFAEVVNLGKLMPPGHLRAALRSIFRYNFRDGFGDFPNTQRLYAMNDEKGLLLCSWPRGSRPALPFVYSDEVWTGIEYQVAAHLIYEGMLKEGVAIVDAVRDRYDGVRRNPWNEIECGHHYARAMSSWSLLLAWSGFSYSAPDKELRFQPRQGGDNFRCLYSAGTAWGNYSQRKTPKAVEVELTVEGGALDLAVLRFPFAGQKAKVSLEAETQIANGELTIRLRRPQRIEGGKFSLTVS